MYTLSFAEVVRKQQRSIPKKDLEKIEQLILSLQNNPRPPRCKKLVGGEDMYRVRFGDWRILYAIDDRKKTLVIYGILNRKEAYR
jgi:mRNA interferase RelE/StbE